MTDTPPPEPVDPPPLKPASPTHGTVVRLFGSALMAIGGLIGGLSGACSGVGLLFVLGSLFSNGGSGFMETLTIVVLFGGPPLAVGLGLFFWGRALRR